ncbi:MAG: PD-(D/E)XK nuclease family protein, partial [Candidatus Diapherotrites archaeon]|nr:PD-(D/E)XK nuclease family protein [Candidatus Diapherotrites archaeon]
MKKGIKLQEERRLAYVAFTRAKKTLTITHPKAYNDEDREVSEFYKDLNLQEKYIIEKTITESQLAQSISPETQEEQTLRQQKKSLLEGLEQNDLNSVLEHAQLYIGLKKGKIPLLIESSNAERLEKELEKLKTGQKHFEYAIEITHSVSSLGVYHDCPKKYELSQILHMPSKNDFTTGTGMDMGSLFHEVAEKIAELAKNKVTIAEIKAKTPELIKAAKA